MESARFGFAPLTPSDEPVAQEAQDPFAFMGAQTTEVSAAAVAVGPPAVFSLDKSLTAIEFAAAEEIVDLHESLNKARITPEGHQPQNCGAYVCGLLRNGGRRVYVALLLTESGKVLVYAPDKQPETDAVYAKTVRDALDFAETVGFMLGAVELDADMEKRSRVLSGMPVLRQCGN